MPLVDLLETPVKDGCLFQLPSLAGLAGFRHAITAAPWNMSAHVGPGCEDAETHRRTACDFLGMPFDRLTTVNQIHSNHVLRIDTGDIGRGRHGPETALPFLDGVVCNLADVPVMQFSADCPLIVLVNPDPLVFGMAHASWRGTVAGITTELVKQLEREFDVAPSNLCGGICPCAGPAEYEVGDEVRRIATARLGDGATRFFQNRDDRLYFDMRTANLTQLEDAGVNLDRIEVANVSTIADERFWSHRRQAKAAGRFALVAGISGAS